MYVFVHVYMYIQLTCMKTMGIFVFVCAGSIVGIGVGALVVLFGSGILTVVFMFIHRKHRIQQNRKLQWSDMIEEVSFIVQVRFGIELDLIVV